MPHSHQLNMFLKYRNIPKISSGAYIFQRLFSRGFFFWRGIFTEAKFAFQNLLG